MSKHTPEPWTDKQIVDRLVASMQEHPWEWSFDNCWAKHETGVAVWISNGAAFVEIYSTDRIGAPHFRPGWLDRRRIYKLAKEIKRRDEGAAQMRNRAAITEAVRNIGVGKGWHLDAPAPGQEATP